MLRYIYIALLCKKRGWLHFGCDKNVLEYVSVIYEFQCFTVHFFNSIIDKHQHMHISHSKTVLV